MEIFNWYINNLSRRYETAATKLEELKNQHDLRSRQDKAMALFIRFLKKQPLILDEWNDAIWTVMVEKAVIHKDGQITFVFYNGTEINVVT